MDFKPTKQKIIVSVLTIVAFYISLVLLYSIYPCLCSPCPPSFTGADCEKVLVINILPDSCNCGCTCPTATPISKITLNLFTLLLPGILVYLIWSLIQKKK